MKVPNTKDNMMKCICGQCPSYIQGDKGFYCAQGKSDKITEKKGCICMQCPLWKEYGLTSGYFCTEGAAE